MAWCQVHGPFIVHKTHISIHTFVRYVKVSGYEAMQLFCRKTTSAFTVWAAIIFEAIIDISSE